MTLPGLVLALALDAALPPLALCDRLPPHSLCVHYSRVNCDLQTFHERRLRLQWYRDDLQAEAAGLRCRGQLWCLAIVVRNEETSEIRRRWALWQLLQRVPDLTRMPGPVPGLGD